MSGMTDIKTAFQAALGPDCSLKSAVMNYDAQTGEQVLTFVVLTPTGERTEVERIHGGAMTPALVDLAMQVAQRIIRPQPVLVPPENRPQPVSAPAEISLHPDAVGTTSNPTLQTTTNPQPVQTPSPMANLIGGSAPIFDNEAHGPNPELKAAHTAALDQIKSGKYKFVEDGTPPPKPHLFF